MTADPAEQIWSSIAGCCTDVPLPGSGGTPQRWQQLWELATISPAAARLGEAQFDAVAILTEADRPVPPMGRFGVWAARGPHDCTLVAEQEGWRLRGEKPWCTGATSVTHALVTADQDGRSSLVLVDMHGSGVELPPSMWATPAFAATGTRTVRFDVLLDDSALIGVDDWYLRRPGFWHGAVGVAACWAGSVAGIVARVRPAWPTHSHAMAHLGAVDAQLWSMRAALDEAGQEIDAAPVDMDRAHRRALRVRHIVDTAIDDVLRRITRALGPAPLAHLPNLHVQLAEVDLYRRQCHAERDLEALGTLVDVPGEPDP